MSSKSSRSNYSLALLIFGSLIVSYPFLFVILTSFKSNIDFAKNPWLPSKNIVFENYVYAFNIAYKYFLNSIIVVFSSVLLILLFSVLCGYALSKLHFPKKGLMLFTLLVVLVIPIETTLLPISIMYSRIGLLGTYLGIIIPYIAWGLPLSILIAYNYINTIPGEILESARIDGSSDIGSFYRILLPMITPILATIAIFMFCNFWGEYLWASVSSSTNIRIQTLPLAIVVFQQLLAIEVGRLAAAISIVVVPLIIVFSATQKYFIKGIISDSVKG